jgi:enoyl-CoA hydratase/carnithine racemase
MSDLVSYTVVEPGIAQIVIERADRMNALNEGVIQGLRNAWQRFADSDERVAVLAAAGERAFSVGADIKDAPREMWQGVPSVGVELFKPVIAAVHGWCIGGAYVIVQMCDLVVAAQNTVFKYPEAQVGFTGGLIASAVERLPHKVAMEFMLLGQDLTAQRAYEVGMVNQVVPDGRQRNAALVYARILARSAPLVVETLKRFALQTLNASPAEAAALARRGLLAVRDSADGAEGRRAFTEKRPPSFTGR